MESKKHLVYISHPSGGLEENTLDIEKVVRKLIHNDAIYNNFCLVSPVHCYGFMYKEFEDNYFKGLSFCTDLLLHCDLMIVVGDWENSTGCKEEVRLCKEKGIPCIFIESSDIIDAEIEDGLFTRMIELVKDKTA